jgi:hypothetical protein
MRPLPDIQTPTFSFDLDHDYVHHLLCGALWGKGKEMSSVQTVIDIEVYLDSGLLSGLAAMSELRELLDELYESLS